MKFDYSEEQQLLADSVRRFVAQDYAFDARRKIVASPEGHGTKVWSTLAELGLLGIPFSSDDGGFGGGAVDLIGVMEAFGEALVVEPYLSTLMGARLVAKAGSAEMKARILPAVIQYGSTTSARPSSFITTIVSSGLPAPVASPPCASGTFSASTPISASACQCASP